MLPYITPIAKVYARDIVGSRVQEGIRVLGWKESGGLKGLGFENLGCRASPSIQGSMSP